MSILLKSNIEKTIHKSISTSDFEIFLAFMKEQSFQKKSLLAEEGIACDTIYFIQQGSCYSFITDLKGERHSMQFATEAHWISDLFSFFSGQNAVYGIEALEPLTVLSLSKINFQKACDTLPIVNQFFRILIQNAYVSLQQRLAKTNSEEAEKRYWDFAKQYPDFLQRIPQYLIASYLGIKPQSLSRIRSEQVHKAK